MALLPERIAKREAGEVLKRARDLLDRAEGEHRDVTEAEEAAFNRLVAMADNLVGFAGLRRPSGDPE